MGKKYFCDYCDKSFADNPVNRRNHLNGVVHKQMKDMHYRSFAGKLFTCIIAHKKTSTEETPKSKPQ